MFPARVTVHIQDFFNTLDLVVAAEQVVEADINEGGDDQDSDSPINESESLNLDQPEASGVQKSTEKKTSHEIKEA